MSLYYVILIKMALASRVDKEVLTMAIRHGFRFLWLMMEDRQALMEAIPKTGILPDMEFSRNPKGLNSDAP